MQIVVDGWYSVVMVRIPISTAQHREAEADSVTEDQLSTQGNEAASKYNLERGSSGDIQPVIEFMISKRSRGEAKED
jgi:hypothetical protein